MPDRDRSIKILYVHMACYYLFSADNFNLHICIHRKIIYKQKKTVTKKYKIVVKKISILIKMSKSNKTSKVWLFFDETPNNNKIVIFKYIYIIFFVNSLYSIVSLL